MYMPSTYCKYFQTVPKSLFEPVPIEEQLKRLPGTDGKAYDRLSYTFDGEKHVIDYPWSKEECIQSIVTNYTSRLSSNHYYPVALHTSSYEQAILNAFHAFNDTLSASLQRLWMDDDDNEDNMSGSDPHIGESFRDSTYAGGEDEEGGEDEDDEEDEG